MRGWCGGIDGSIGWRERGELYEYEYGIMISRRFRESRGGFSASFSTKVSLALNIAVQRPFWGSESEAPKPPLLRYAPLGPGSQRPFQGGSQTTHPSHPAGSSALKIAVLDFFTPIFLSELLRQTIPPIRTTHVPRERRP
jgi:hypothetical protein